MSAAGGGGSWRLRLYVAGEGPGSTAAESNLRRICEQHLGGRPEVEVVDFLLDPERALADGVLVTPTLIKLAPGRRTSVIGTLSETDTVLRALGVDGHGD